MNIYLAVGGAMACAFMGGFLAQYLISRGQKKVAQAQIQHLVMEMQEAMRKRDARGRYCK